MRVSLPLSYVILLVFRGRGSHDPSGWGGNLPITHVSSVHTSTFTACDVRSRCNAPCVQQCMEANVAFIPTCQSAELVQVSPAGSLMSHVAAANLLWITAVCSINLHCINGGLHGGS